MTEPLSIREEPAKNWILRHTWPLSWFFVLSLHLVTLGILYWSIRSREDLVILRYNAYLGIDLLGMWWQVFLMPAMTFVFVLVNFLLAKLLFNRGYPSVAALFLIGSFLLSGSVVVVAATLSFINV